MDCIAFKKGNLCGPTLYLFIIIFTGTMDENIIMLRNRLIKLMRLAHYGRPCYSHFFHAVKYGKQEVCC